VTAKKKTKKNKKKKKKNTTTKITTTTTTAKKQERPCSFERSPLVDDKILRTSPSAEPPSFPVSHPFSVSFFGSQLHYSFPQ